MSESDIARVLTTEDHRRVLPTIRPVSPLSGTVTSQASTRQTEEGERFRAHVQQEEGRAEEGRAEEGHTTDRGTGADFTEGKPFWGLM
jgi:hypothetical protein